MHAEGKKKGWRLGHRTRHPKEEVLCLYYLRCTATEMDSQNVGNLINRQARSPFEGNPFHIGSYCPSRGYHKIRQSSAIIIRSIGNLLLYCRLGLWLTRYPAIGPVSYVTTRGIRPREAPGAMETRNRKNGEGNAQPHEKRMRMRTESPHPGKPHTGVDIADRDGRLFARCRALLGFIDV